MGATAPAPTSSRPVPRHERFPILGVPISAMTPATAVDTMVRWIETGAREYVCVCTVHEILRAQDDPGMLAAIAAAGMATPDGMPLVWLGKRRGYEVDRVYGPDLMLDLLGRSESAGYRHFFYGGGPGVAGELVARLRTRFPRLEVAGTLTPPFRALSPEEDRDACEQINRSRADVVWVALGGPKQNRWMAEHRPRLDAPVLAGVGAAFDFHAGRKRQAPRWMQRHGLEWAFRLAQEPRRLWRRYLVGNTIFLGLLATEALRRGGRASVAEETVA